MVLQFINNQRIIINYCFYHDLWEKLMAAHSSSRDVFASRLGMLAATLGSAVGLGNIWKFPFLTGENGGASFLLLYVLATLVVGLPVMIAELTLGRAAKANAVSTFRKLAPGTEWWLIGLSGVASAIFILGFYTDVAGWVLSYIYKSIMGTVNTTDPIIAAGVFESMASSPVEPVFWQWLTFGIIAAIILRGASKGIEKVTRILLPLLFLLLLVVCARSLSLPNASEGLRFLFSPDFSRVDGAVVLTALGLAFFKLSLGMSVMLTYGSYFREDVNIPFMCARVVFFDLLVSMLAGIAIFPAVFAFGFEPTAGPGLLFMTVPAVFASMPGGYFFTIIFFFLSGIATIGAMLSLLEAVVAYVSEGLGISRKKATISSVVLLALFGLPATLSIGILSNVNIFGLSFFDLYDFISSNVLMPLGGVAVCLFIGYGWKTEKFVAALSNGGALRNEKLARIIVTLCRTVTPLLIVIILLQGLREPISNFINILRSVLS